ncbi:MAG: Ig-like domain-containing protein [Paludibacteraceae bacterium]|nr:Ig-like domain-containing protein [Paludibacteraceae bacterium]
MKKILAFAMAALALVACKKNQDATSVTGIKLDQEAITIKVGEAQELKATIQPEGAKATIAWESSAPGVAKVTAGLVEGVSAGTAYIIATAEGQSARCRVTVYEEGQTVVTLNKLAVELEVGATEQLVATVQPEEKAAELQWESKNAAVATVNASGLVTAVAAGTAEIRAFVGDVEASCQVTVKSQGGGGGEEIHHVSLEGTDYFVFQMGGQAAEQIADRIVADFRPNDNDKNLWVWENTYNAGETSGKNFYGEAEGWVSLQVTSVGWSGCAYACDDLAELNKLSAIMDAPGDYYLHLAMKSTDNASHLLFLDGTSGSGKVCIGSAAFVDNGTTYQPYTNFTRNGDWGEIEIPMSYLINQGLVYGNNNPKGLNVFGFLSGGQTGTMLQFDAAFIYKKAAAE